MIFYCAELDDVWVYVGFVLGGESNNLIHYWDLGEINYSSDYLDKMCQRYDWTFIGYV